MLVMSNDYRVLVFLKNCLLRSVLECGDFEIVPFDGLGCTDELNLMQAFLTRFQPGSLNETDNVIEQAKRGQPTVVVHFRRLAAPSAERCFNLAEHQAELLSCLLAIQRHSYGSVVGTIIQDLTTGGSRWRIRVPNYTGNLLGGILAGENAETLSKRFEKVQRNDSLQLYVKLFREAREEEDAEFAYYRFWTLLEMIARAKNLAGQPLLDWDGQPVMNRHGMPRTIEDAAEPLVGELVRRAYAACRVSGLFLGVGHTQDMIPVWYRHRNCISHHGGCRPDDQNHCYRTSQQFVACRSAHLAAIVRSNLPRGRHADDMLKALEDAARLVIIVELQHA
jgi:hypothetical protein